MNFIDSGNGKLVMVDLVERLEGGYPDDSVVIAEAVEDSEGYYVAKLNSDIVYSRGMCSWVEKGLSKLNRGLSNQNKDIE